MTAAQFEVRWTQRCRATVHEAPETIAAWAVSSGILRRLPSGGAPSAATCESVVEMMRSNPHFAAFVAGRFHLAQTS